MDFIRPDDLSELDGLEGTTIIPSSDMRIDCEVIFTQQLEKRHHHKEELSLFKETDLESVIELDLEALLQLCEEHRMYSAAQGFSDSQIDVLRAIQHEDNQRVLTAEVLRSPWTERYSDQAVHAALQTLCDRQLIRKEAKGVYRYIGPANIKRDQID